MAMKRKRVHAKMSTMITNRVQAYRDVAYDPEGFPQCSAVVVFAHVFRQRTEARISGSLEFVRVCETSAKQ